MTPEGSVPSCWGETLIGWGKSCLRVGCASAEPQAEWELGVTPIPWAQRKVLGAGKAHLAHYTALAQPCLCLVLAGSRLEEKPFSEMEMSYIKQGEEALQKSLRILEDQDDWKTETVAVGALHVVLPWSPPL